MSSIPSSSPPSASVDALITFDAHGVSAHTNHISLHNGCVSFIKALMHRHTGWDCPVTLYSLTSVNVVRKYISVLDAPFTMLACVLGVGSKGKVERGERPSMMFFLSWPGGYVRAQGAMVRAHRSQMRWFRWGWIAVGRYMVVNDLRKVKVA